MDADTKVLLDEVQKRISDELSKLLTDRDAKWEQRVADSERRTDDRFAHLESAAKAFVDWRPQIEASVEDVKLELDKLVHHWDRSVRDRAATDPGIFPIPKLVSERPPAPDPNTDGPAGHRVDNNYRDLGGGTVLIHTHVPVKGACSFSAPPSPKLRFQHDHLNWPLPRHNPPPHDPPHTSRLPKLQFPVFEGENPKLWLSRCEDYFDMYHVPPDLCVRVAVSQIKGAAAGWTQSVDSRLKYASWQEFVSLVMDRFGRDQHESVLRQFFRLRQTGPVAEYVEQFMGLVDHLTAYGQSSDPLYYTTRFIDGLRDDIRFVVLIHRPSTLDSACSLAMLQEEVAEPVRRRDFRRSDGAFPPKQPGRGPFPLPAPPPRLGKPSSHPHVPGEHKQAEDLGKSPTDKFAALKAYRRARGLCDRCAEKWCPGHQCATSIQLNALQELLDLFDGDQVEAANDLSAPDHSQHEEAQLSVVLSQEAVSGSEGPQTMKFVGSIQGHQLQILVDSGSTHTFLSRVIADHLVGVSQLPTPLIVQVANGGILQCDSALLSASWAIQDITFSSNLKILPLPHFDLIIGMDWLESFSPMKVYWKSKWMTIPYNGAMVLLQGIKSDLHEELVVQVSSLSDNPETNESSQNIIPEIALLIREFQSIFEPVSGLPPSRACDHEIPLVPGAKPVYIRPYRYPPALKDEIEKQVQEMLQKGIIQPSSSPFSSPMLLVKKKDGSWPPCVDYRHLNALTVRGNSQFQFLMNWLMN